MVTNTEAYKGAKFTCNKCGYVVSSDATDDFNVEDFQFCPYCGNSVAEEVPVTKQQTNADRIRSLSDEELAKMILKLNLEDMDDVIPFCENSYLCSEKLRNDEEIPDGLCRECLMEWLQSEVQEEKE